MHPADPYAPPLTQVSSAEPEAQQALGELVKGWEKLRMLYNALLLLPGIAVLAVNVSQGGMNVPIAITSGLLCGLGANGAYFAGPLAELYLRAILFKSKPSPLLRKALFAGGILISLGCMGLFLLGTFAINLLPTPD